MKPSDELTNMINDLVLINNDRIEGYQKAIEAAGPEDSDLKKHFAKTISHSRDHILRLRDTVWSLGGEVEEGTTVKGKIFRSWMDVKTFLSLNDRESILKACESGEEAALEAYDMALASDLEMKVDIRQLLMDQRVSIKIDSNHISKLLHYHNSLA
jgi:uncharacterized protein (TIGR02284 family)